jgi:hypothetical protein
MKKNIFFLFLLASVIFAGCEKNDGMVPKEIPLERVPAPVVTKDPTGSASLDLTNLGAFNGKVNVGLYFPNDIPPAKFDIVIKKNNTNSNVKVFKAGVTTFPSLITITAAQLATLFGTAIVLNDTYEVGVDVYAQSGKKYEAFPLVGQGYAAAFQPDHPGFNTSVIFSAICAYRGDLFAPIGGTANFQVITDEWGDDPVNGWGPPAGYRPTVAVTVVDATHLSFKSPVNGTSTIVLTINPLDNAITYTGQPYGNLAVGPLQVDPTWTFGNGTIENVGINNVAPCALQLNLAVRYRVAAGTFSNGGVGYKLVLRKI